MRQLALELSEDTLGAARDTRRRRRRTVDRVDAGVGRRRCQRRRRRARGDGPRLAQQMLHGCDERHGDHIAAATLVSEAQRHDQTGDGHHVGL